MDFWNLGVIMQKELRDATRNRWFILTSIIFAGLSLGLSLLGFSGMGTLGVTGFGRTAASLVNLVMFIVPLMGLLLGSMSLVTEREQGTLRALLTQPVTASEIFLGKFLGDGLALSATILMGFGLSGGIIGLSGGTAQISHYLILLGLTLLLGLVYTAIGFVISVLVSGSLAAVGWATFFWFLMIFGTDLGWIGGVFLWKWSASSLAMIAFSNPSHLFKIGMVGSLQNDLEALGAAGRLLLDQFGDFLLLLLSVSLVVWMILPLAAALMIFKRRSA